MSEEVWLAVGDRLVRAQPITVYVPVKETPQAPEVLATAVEAPPSASVEAPKTGWRYVAPYSPEMRASILAEANRPGALVKQVAQRYGINPSSIYYWRHRSLKANEKRLARQAS